MRNGQALGEGVHSSQLSGSPSWSAREENGEQAWREDERAGNRCADGADEDGTGGDILGRLDQRMKHAELSWQIHEWARALLSEAERGELAEAARRALAELRRELAHDWGSAVRSEAGMPGPRQAQALLGALETALWSPGTMAA